MKNKQVIAHAHKACDISACIIPWLWSAYKMCKKNIHAFMHIGQAIKNELNKQGRKVCWLAKQIPCDRRNIYYIFQNEDIDTSTLKRISIILQHDFFEDISKEINVRNNTSLL